MIIKKHHGFEIRGLEFGFWDSKRDQIQSSDFGAIQIWKVLEKDKLVGSSTTPQSSILTGLQDLIHQREVQQKRGVKDHPLRFEIAIASDKMLLVIGGEFYLQHDPTPTNLKSSITSPDQGCRRDGPIDHQSRRC